MRFSLSKDAARAPPPVSTAAAAPDARRVSPARVGHCEVSAFAAAEAGALLPSLYLDLPTISLACAAAGCDHSGWTAADAEAAGGRRFWNEEWQLACSMSVETAADAARRLAAMRGVKEAFEQEVASLCRGLLAEGRTPVGGGVGGGGDGVPGVSIRRGVVLRLDAEADAKAYGGASRLGALMTRELLAAAEILQVAPFLCTPVVLPLCCVVVTRSRRCWAYAALPLNVPGAPDDTAHQLVTGFSTAAQGPATPSSPVVETPLSSVYRADAAGAGLSAPLPPPPPPASRGTAAVGAVSFAASPEVFCALREIGESLGCVVAEGMPLAAPVSVCAVRSGWDARLYLYDVARFLPVAGSSALPGRATSRAEALDGLTRTVRPELLRAMPRAEHVVEAASPYAEALRFKHSWNNAVATGHAVTTLGHPTWRRRSAELARRLEEGGVCDVAEALHGCGLPLRSLGTVLMLEADATATPSAAACDAVYAEMAARAYKETLGGPPSLAAAGDGRGEVTRSVVLLLAGCSASEQAAAFFADRVLPVLRRRYPSVPQGRFRCLYSGGVACLAAPVGEAERALAEKVSAERGGEPGPFPRQLYHAVLRVCPVRVSFYGRLRAVTVRTCTIVKGLCVRPLRSTEGSAALAALCEQRGSESAAAALHLRELALWHRWAGCREELACLHRAAGIRLKRNSRLERESARAALAAAAQALHVWEDDQSGLRALARRAPTAAQEEAAAAGGGGDGDGGSTRVFDGLRSLEAVRHLAVCPTVSRLERQSLFARLLEDFTAKVEVPGAPSCRERVHELFYFASFQIGCLETSKCRACKGRPAVVCRDFCTDGGGGGTFVSLPPQATHPQHPPPAASAGVAGGGGGAAAAGWGGRTKGGPRGGGRETRTVSSGSSTVMGSRSAGRHHHAQHSLSVRSGVPHLSLVSSSGEGLECGDPFSVPWADGTLLCGACHEKLHAQAATRQRCLSAWASPTELLRRYLVLVARPQFSQTPGDARVVKARLLYADATQDARLFESTAAGWDVDPTRERMFWVHRWVELLRPAKGVGSEGSRSSGGGGGGGGGDGGLSAADVCWRFLDALFPDHRFATTAPAPARPATATAAAVTAAAATAAPVSAPAKRRQHSTSQPGGSTPPSPSGAQQLLCPMPPQAPPPPPPPPPQATPSDEPFPAWRVAYVVYFVDVLAEGSGLVTLQNIAHALGFATPRIDASAAVGDAPSVFRALRRAPLPDVAELRTALSRVLGLLGAALVAVGGGGGSGGGGGGGGSGGTAGGATAYHAAADCFMPALYTALEVEAAGSWVEVLLSHLRDLQVRLRAVGRGSCVYKADLIEMCTTQELARFARDSKGALSQTQAQQLVVPVPPQHGKDRSPSSLSASVPRVSCASASPAAAQASPPPPPVPPPPPHTAAAGDHPCSGERRGSGRPPSQQHQHRRAVGAVAGAGPPPMSLEEQRERQSARIAKRVRALTHRYALHVDMLVAGSGGPGVGIRRTDAYASRMQRSIAALRAEAAELADKYGGASGAEDPVAAVADAGSERSDKPA